MNSQSTARKALPTSAAPPRSASVKPAPTLTCDGYRIGCKNLLAFALFGSQMETLKVAGCPQGVIEILKRRFIDLLNLYDVSRPIGKLRSFVPVVPWPLFSLKEQCLALADNEGRLQIPPFLPMISRVETEPYFAANLHVHRTEAFAPLELEMERIDKAKEAFPKKTRYLSVAAVLGVFRATPKLRGRGLYVPEERYLLHSTRTSFQIVKAPDDFTTPNHLLVLTAETFIPDGHPAR